MKIPNCPLCQSYNDFSTIYEFGCRNCGLWIIETVSGKRYYYKSIRYLEEEFQQWIKLKAFW